MQIAEVAVGFEAQRILAHGLCLETEVDKLSVVAHHSDGIIDVIIDDVKHLDFRVVMINLVETDAFAEHRVSHIRIVAVLYSEHEAIETRFGWKI